MIRVLIADDHMVVREGLRAILETAPDLLPVGEATDGAEAVRLVQETTPDVVLMDLRMPGMDGIEAIRRIEARYPDVQVVILTTYDDDDDIVRGLCAGARGYLLKDTGRNALFDAIRAAARGESLLPAEVIDKVVAHLQGPQLSEPAMCPRGRGRSWPCWPRAQPTKRSLCSSASRSAQSKGMSRASLTSWALAPALKPWPSPCAVACCRRNPHHKPEQLVHEMLRSCTTPSE